MQKDKTLKIAMLSIHSCPLGQLGSKDTGGMNVYVRELARELGTKGNQVDIYTRAHDPQDAQIYYLSSNVRLIHIDVGKNHKIGKLDQYKHLPIFYSRMQKFCMTNSLTYDIVHSHYWLSGKVGQRFSQLWNAPHIIMFHTLGSIKQRLGFIENEMPQRLAVEQNLVRYCSHIIASTQKEKQDLIKSYFASAEKITIIPCGVNLSLFKPSNSKKALRWVSPKSIRSILFVGRIEPLKGIDKLLVAVSYLKKRHKLKLLIIGDDDTSNPEIRKLQDLTEQLGIKKSVSFLGPRPQEELPHFYNIADLCVVPSQYESFGLVVLEAMACGTPVIATPVGIANDIIQPKKNGYLLKDDDPRNMAQLINQLLFVNQDEVGDVGAVRESVVKFDWSNIATAIMEKYNSLIRYPITIP